MAVAALDNNLVTLITPVELAREVKRIAAQLDSDYSGKQLVVVGILNGAFVFLADLIRQMSIPIERVEFLKISSYGPKTVTSGNPKFCIELYPEHIDGRHVVLVEDIVDTGITAVAALDHVRGLRAASVEICTLLDKPAKRRVQVPVRYKGFEISDTFVVGYGLDYGQKYRQLPAIYSLQPTGTEANLGELESGPETVD